MLIKEIYPVKVDKRTCVWYKQRGYNIENKIIKVESQDLHENSLIKIQVKCDYCEKIYEKEFRNYIRQNKKARIHKDACCECKSYKTKESNASYLNFDEKDLEIKEKRKALSRIYRYDKNYGIKLNEILVVNTFSPVQWWKWTFYTTPNGNRLPKLPVEMYEKDNLKKTFKYVIENEIGYKTREDLLQLDTKKLREFKIYFNTDYESLQDILNLVYDSYNIKEYELANVPLNYWKSKENCDKYMRHFIENIIGLENVQNTASHIFTFANIRSLGYSNLAWCLTNYRYYDNFYQWVKFLYPDLNISEDDFYLKRAYDGTQLNSKEEVKLYEFIKREMNINVQSIGLTKKDYKIYNSEFNENYIPDFIIKTKDNKNIIIEYFGLYRENYGNSKILKMYFDKTKRKIEFYTRQENIKFIDLYPEDLMDNCKGVKEKLTSFLFA
jgi:hypothetical protein